MRNKKKLNLEAYRAPHSAKKELNTGGGTPFAQLKWVPRLFKGYLIRRMNVKKGTQYQTGYLICPAKKGTPSVKAHY